MLINWEQHATVARGSSANAFHDEEGLLQVIFLPEGTQQPHIMESVISLGMWDNVVFNGPVPIAPDNDIISINLRQMHEANMWLVWETETQHRFAVTPDDGEIMDPETPYRLYYAVDTEKLYMNISEVWEFIGSPRLDKLVGSTELINQVLVMEGASDALADEMRLGLTTLNEDFVEHNAAATQDKEETESKLVTANSAIALLEAKVQALIDGLPPPTDPEPEPEPEQDPETWKILVVGDDITNAGTSEVSTALTNMGHSITSQNTSSVLTHDLTPYDLIVITRTSSIFHLSYIKDSNKPYLLGFTQEGIATAASILGLASERHISSGPIMAIQTVDVSDHLITRLLSKGQYIDTYVQHDYLNYVIGALGTSLLSCAEFSAGNSTLNVVDGAKRIASCGFVYRNMSSASIGILDRTVKWLMREDAWLSKN